MLITIHFLTWICEEVEHGGEALGNGGLVFMLYYVHVL